MQCVHTGRGTSDSCKKKRKKESVCGGEPIRAASPKCKMLIFFCNFAVSLSLIRCGPLKSCCSLASYEAKMSTAKNCIIALIRMLPLSVTQRERNMVKYQQQQLVSAS